jgi:hypothetical protein
VADPTAPRPVAVVAAPIPRVTVEIRAANIFCNPSIDEQPAGMTPATYVVKAGLHRIFCTMPSGDRLLAGNLRIGPPKEGGAFRILLRKNGDKPVVDAKFTSVVAEPPTPSTPAAPPATESE